MNEFIQTIFRRRSIRKYTDRPVDDETLTLLLKAAMAAPTATNSQPWEFIVITEAETLDRVRSKLLFARYNAPAAIVVCGNPSIANSSSGQRYWDQDCCAAAENILIAATGLGLGSVWIGVHPLPGVIKTVREILEIPQHVIPLALIYVGHPAEEKPARTQYDAHRVHWHKYEPRKRKLKIKNAKYL